MEKKCWVCRRNTFEIARDSLMPFTFVNESWNNPESKKIDEAFGKSIKTEEHYKGADKLFKNINLCLICYSLIRLGAFGGLVKSKD